jgi:urease accessory protein
MPVNEPTIMTTATLSSRTETWVSVTRPIDGSRVRVEYRAVGGPDRPVIRPVLLSSDARGAHVSLVPEGALLLAGDVVSLRIDVGPGATLQLVEPAGTVAYDMRGCCATWDVTVNLGPGSCLVWHGEPFVASAGSETIWTTRVFVDYGARLALRETLVLGRHGEEPGRLRHEVHVQHADGRPVLADGVDLAPRRTGIVLGGHRVMGTVLLVGAELGDAEWNSGVPGTRFEFETGGVLVRTLVDDAHRATDLRIWNAAVAAVIGD